MADDFAAVPASKRSRAGFFSSVSSFSLPVGSQIATEAVRGYYIDMRIKAETPRWPLDWSLLPEPRLHVVAAQWGLGSYERYLAGEGEQWLKGALRCADELVESQEREGPLEGGWVHSQAFRHTFALDPPWLSAMAQGEAASLLVRMFGETRDERYAQAARRALGPFEVDARDGGVRAMLDGRSFPEEYPTDPPSFVLNGGIFAIWGLHDVGVGLGDSAALARFQQAVDTLAANLHHWDLGYWSRYDLFPHPVANVASSFYHDLHVKQLRVMQMLAPHPEILATAKRWDGYVASATNRRRAFAQKSLFRLLVPRSRSLARLLPWSPLHGA